MGKMRSTREGYGEGLLLLGEKNNNLVVLDADTSCSTKTDIFARKFPHRFFNVGVAEQNLMGIAAGLSLTGKIAFASGYSIFVSGKAWDQIRNIICYCKLNVKIGATHAGITVGADGATHQALEDIALMRVIPNMNVVVPCDAVEARKAVFTIAEEIQGPVYLRLGRGAVPSITQESTPFIFGKALTLNEGKDVTIIACGIMVWESLKAVEELKEEGISVKLLNFHTIKPPDEEAIIQAAKQTRALVTAEEHQIIGGLGGMVSEIIAREMPVPLEMVGVKNSFGESGEASELMEKFGLTAKEIVKAVKRVLKKKKTILPL
ncbi:transketolase family protein [bacterium]|nr:transketolase family protein [bacterium]